MDHPHRSTGTSTISSNHTSANKRATDSSNVGKPPIDNRYNHTFSGPGAQSRMYSGNSGGGGPQSNFHPKASSNASRPSPIIEKNESFGPIQGTFSSGIQRHLYSWSNAELKAAPGSSSAVGEWGKKNFISETESRGVISFESNKNKTNSEERGNSNYNSSILRMNHKGEGEVDAINESFHQMGLENKFGGIAIHGGVGSSSQKETQHLPLHAYASSYLKTNNRTDGNFTSDVTLSNPLMVSGPRRIPPIYPSSTLQTWRRPSNSASKVHPTAVSSYGTTNFSKFNKTDAASVISSAYGGSSFSGLYRRRRKLSITPDGFPYIPSLHLTKSSSSRAGGDGGSMGGAGVSGGNGLSSSISPFGEASRFQNSYLLKGTHGGAVSPTANEDHEYNKKNRFPSPDRTSNRIGPLIQSGAKIKAIRENPPSLLSSFSLDGTDDGYDSASNRIERLREWKRQQYMYSSNMEKSLEKSSRDSSKKEISKTIESKSISSSLDAPKPLRNNSNQSNSKPSTDQFTSEKRHHRDSVQTKQDLNSNSGEKTTITNGFFPVTSPSRGKKTRRMRSESVNKSTKLGHDLEDEKVIISSHSRHLSNGNKIEEENEVVDNDNILNHAANFLFSLSPPLSPRAKIPEISLDEICTPMIENESFDDPMSTESSSPMKMNSRPPTHLNLPRQIPSKIPKRFQSSHSSTTDDLDSSHCSLNPHGRNLSFSTNDKENTFFTSGSVSTWENCLYVRAEGARRGRIYLTTSHLIFIYEDDVAEDILFEHGWDHERIDRYLMESPSLKATPIDIPLDEAGEGGGVELVGNNIKKAKKKEEECCHFESKFVEMLEFGFEDIVESISTRQSNDREVAESVTVTSSNDVAKVTMKEKGANERKSLEASLQTHVETQSPIEHDCHSPVSPTSVTSSQRNILSSESECFVEESYEEVMNKCIIRAIKEEARRRLQELDDEEDSATKISTAASYSAWDKLEVNNTEYDYGSVYGHQTNISSFSESEFDIDIDAERMKYITGEDENSARNFIGIQWQLSKLGETFPRRYMLKDVALEIFGPSSSSEKYTQIGDGFDIPVGRLGESSLLLVIPDSEEMDENERITNRFGVKKTRSRRDTFLHMMKENAPNLDLSFWCQYRLDSSGRRFWVPSSFLKDQGSRADPLKTLTDAWTKGYVSNFNYLLRLNAITGRSVHDPGNYPIMPWVLSNYTSQSVPDLSDSRNFRDLSKPMGALDPERLKKFIDRYDTLCAGDSAIPPFMYGSHYSNTGGVVLHYLVRLRPFAGLHRQLQVRAFF